MKTSSKILLGGGLAVLVLILSLAFYVDSVLGTNFDVNINPERIRGNGVTAEEIRNIQPFEKIEVSNGIHVHLKQDEKYTLKVVADENLLEYILTDVRDGKLHIHTRKKLKNARNLNVYVTMPELNKLSINSGAKASSELALNGDFINVDGSSGARSDLELMYNEVDIHVSSGAHLDVRGDVKKGKFHGSSGAHLNADNLMVEGAEADASSGGHLNLGETQKLSVNASSGGHVNYRGNPEFGSINLSSGGQMNKR